MASKRKKRPDPVQVIEPTPEQLAKGEFGRQVQPGQQAAPYRRTAVIDGLHSKRLISDRTYNALAYYRDQASLCDKSPVKSNCDISPRGGNGPGVAIMSSSIETGRLERELGSLRQIARAIAVDDLTLQEWCIEKHGGIEYTDNKTNVVSIVPRNAEFACRMALLELKMAADRLTRPGGVSF